MNEQEQVNYHRIAVTIEFKKTLQTTTQFGGSCEASTLTSVSFQRLFHEGTGTTPKSVMQRISVEHAKKLLTKQQASLFATAFQTEPSGSGGLHDLCINTEGVTPPGSKTVVKIYRHIPVLLMARMDIGLWLRHPKALLYGFSDYAVNESQQNLLNATFIGTLDLIQQNALFIFQKGLE